MPSPSSLPLSVARLLVGVGFLLCLSIAALLILVALSLATGWPAIVREAVEKGMALPLAGAQPGLTLVLLGSAAIVAATACILRDMRLLLNTVAAGEPFAAANAMRLRRIGWVMLLTQGIGLLTAFAVATIPWGAEKLHGYGLSFNGVVAAMIAFVLAGVFDQARRMRDDLEGTI